MSNDLDEIKTGQPLKEVTLKTLKRKSNKVVLKALEYLENVLDMESAKVPDKINASKFIVTTHFVILDKEEKEKFKQEQMKGLMLRNQKYAENILAEGEADNYRRDVDSLEGNDNRALFDMGLDVLENGDNFS